MAAPWTPPHGWWDDYPSDEKETSVKCECDFDCVGDPAHYVRANHSILCPIHDKCQVCEERLAVLKVDGDKLCVECAEEDTERTACPNCGNDASFDEQFWHDEVRLVCRWCDKPTDEQEVKRVNEARRADIKQQLAELKEREYVGK